MTCLKDHTIQEYLDGEVNYETLAKIEKHIAKCDKCRSKIDYKKRLSTRIKRTLNLISSNTIDIPEFKVPQIKTRKFTLATRISYVTAAASLLLFVFVIAKKKENKNQDELATESGFAIYIDANRPVSELPLIINVNDGKGNNTEYFIE
jgi:hypothetical protein